jgi:lipoprotein NlpI
MSRNSIIARLLIAAGITLAVGTAPFPARATWTGDAQECANGNTDHKALIDVCTRAIKSGALDAIEKARTYHNRALHRARLGDLANAALDLTEAIKLDPKKPEHRFARGEVSMSRKQFPQAAADFEAALKLDGPSVRGYYLLGAAHIGKGDTDAAIADFTAALKLAPREVPILNERANIYFAKRDWDRALADYTAAIKITPKNPTLYHNRGEVWRITNDLRRAHDDFDTAIRLKPDYESAYIRRGFVRVAERDFKKALADFDKAVQLNKSPETLAQRGIARFYAGRYREAEADLAASVAGAPKNAYGILWLYLARLHQKKDGQAALRDQARALDLTTFPGAVVRFYLGDMTEADAVAAAKRGSAQQQREQLCQTSFYIGEDALLHGHRDEAARLFRQATSTGLTYFYEYQGAAIAMQRLGL